ncbi:outer membrane protein transport protein [Prosthecobacter sp.]|uniref:OmpP1/FadL family transporter n=1 Tax=Prosthecobacter sp. TaxID=1965333 RepID=UPI001DFA5E28|nr:outer membrane protein transport protein [Prosthecobacter sp.]MCB1278009.1 outer membrane protein transport protein [Prosthecobacter sp.]
MKTHACQILLTLTALLSSAYSAETLSVVPDSAQALGIAGGRYANLRDASAVRVSPANILTIEKSELLIDAAMWRGDIRLDSTSGDKVGMSRRWIYPASMYFVQPIVPGKVAFGIGLSTPYGMASIYPKNMSATSGMRYALPYESNLLVADITPAVAFKITDSLSVAVGMEIMYSDLMIKQFYNWSGIIPGSPEGNIQAHGQGWGLGAYMGVNWEFAKGHRLSLVGRLPVRIQYRGDFKATNIPPALAGVFSPTSNFNSDLNFPGSVALGYGVDLTDRWTLGFDFKWTNNNATNDLPLNIGSNQAMLGGQNSAVFNWQDSIELGTGMTYALNERWSLRSGYLFSENSQPASTYSPLVCTNDRHIFSLGVGWRGKTRSVDVTYAYVYNPTRVISGAAQPLFNGNYKHQWQVLALSVTQRF